MEQQHGLRDSTDFAEPARVRSESGPRMGSPLPRNASRFVRVIRQIRSIRVSTFRHCGQHGVLLRLDRRDSQATMTNGTATRIERINGFRGDCKCDDIRPKNGFSSLEERVTLRPRNSPNPLNPHLHLSSLWPAWRASPARPRDSQATMTNGTATRIQRARRGRRPRTAIVATDMIIRRCLYTPDRAG